MAVSVPQFHLLLIGDDPALYPWTKRLEQQGLRVEIFFRGHDGLDRLAGEPVDLVLLDTTLPDMKALAVLRDIRLRFPANRLPIIMITPQRHSQEVVKAFDMGANDFVTKPVEFPVLLARIQARLRDRNPVNTEEPDQEPEPVEEIDPDTILGGKYKIGSLIGRGHFGRVYRARHLKLQRDVAVKVLHPNNRNREELLERFRREGISACQIEHPNAVSVLDYSATDSGLPFLVMELLEGFSLDAEINKRGMLSPLRCAVVLLPVCEVLAEAHSLGIVHRDIKPQNIFLQQTRRGEVVKVLDFGIAKLLNDVASGQELTVDGSGPGTPTYMAPERFSEQPYNGQADVYSLGVTLYEMMAGVPPFRTSTGNPIKLALMHMIQEPPPLCEQNPNLPRPLEEVVLQALAKEPERRPSAARLARDFVEALGLEVPAPFENALSVEAVS